MAPFTAGIAASIKQLTFIDFLSLLKIEQKWLIIAKVFAISFEKEN